MQVKAATLVVLAAVQWLGGPALGAEVHWLGRSSRRLGAEGSATLGAEVACHVLAMSFCVARTPNLTQHRRRTRDNTVALTANEMPWPSPRRLRSTPKKPPSAGARRTSPSRSPSPAPSPRAGHARAQCTRLLPAGLVLVTAIAVFAVAAQTPSDADKTPVSYAEVRLVDRASEIDTTKLMSMRADGRKGVMYLDGQKDTAPSGWAQGLLNKYTRQVLRNATRDVDASRRRREGIDVPPGTCLRVSDDYLQIRDARFEAFVQRGPSGAMAAKAMNTLADGWAATLTHEMIVGCSSSLDNTARAARNTADNNAEGIVTIWWALGSDEEGSTGAARLPGSAADAPRVIDNVAPGDAILAIDRELFDTSAGPVSANGSNPSVFWWYGLTLTRAPSVQHREKSAVEKSEASQGITLEGQPSVDPEAAKAAAEAAALMSALQPILRPWPVSTGLRSYTEPAYSNPAMVLVDKLDQNFDLNSILPTAATLQRVMSELSEHKRVLTEHATTKMQEFADGIRIIAGQTMEVAASTTKDTREAVGTKVSTASEWLSSDPLRRYLAER